MACVSWFSEIAEQQEQSSDFLKPERSKICLQMSGLGLLNHIFPFILHAKGGQYAKYKMP